MIQRRFVPLIVLAVGATFLFLYHSTAVTESWRGLPEKVGLGEIHEAEGDSRWRTDGEHMTSYESLKNWDPKTAFVEGVSKPAGYNWTTRLVIAKTKEENIDWVHEVLPDQQLAVYIADDPTAPLHPPTNKGHEVMVYLTYIIDHYDVLDDVSIFIHAHRWTWHNNLPMGLDTSEIIKRLNPNRVIRVGYQNLRCHWHPGCPDWVHPGVTDVDGNKPEEILLAHAWSELFPFEEIPTVLGQPCCSQFALSRDRIRAIPKARYTFYRDWLLRSKLPDYLSGRIWEYMWQKVFTGRHYDCPAEEVCFCDGYGYCFGNSTTSLKDGYEYYRQLDGEMREWQGKLNNWKDLGRKIEEAKKEGKLSQGEIDALEKPEEGKDKEFEAEINKVEPIVEKMKREAEGRGKDAKERARQLGREWNEGDGY